MKLLRLTLVLVLLASLSIQLASPAKACGPFSIDPIFVFHESPDLPFREFTGGKIGIVQPTFGRKTLVIAYRYLNGGMFSDDEQEALVEALKGKAPEENRDDALKAWIAARKELLAENEQLPEIYVERKNSSYDFFPNCAQNAFEVATATLKDRIAAYGAQDRNVKDWIAAQDVVFQNCSSGSHIPAAAPAGSQRWLQKDRDYQIAAAYFYSLNFEDARQRFAQIASDLDSPWQDTANYLVARTLVRQASLATDEKQKADLNAQAEVALQNLSAASATFQTSARKLLALVKFRLHPEDRVHELAQTLAGMSGNGNLRQDLIDYVWLVDQFEARILTAEKKRREELKPARPEPTPGEEQKEIQSRIEARARGDIIYIHLVPRTADGQEDYRTSVSFNFKYDTSETEMVSTMEMQLNRKLSADELKEVHEDRESGLRYRDYLLSPNRKWGEGGMSAHEDCYDCGQLTFELMPDYLRADDLTDWMLTLKTPDAGAFEHALKRWQETSEHAWLVAALIKAEKTSPGRDRLLRDAEAVSHDASDYPTVAHELARLKMSLGQNEAARKLIDEVLTNSSEALPVSATNQFLEQRTQLAEGLSRFLKYSLRTPAAFFNSANGYIGSLLDQLRFAKADWDPRYFSETKEEWDHDMEKEYGGLLPWHQRQIFAARTIDMFNLHFPLAVLVAAGRDPSVPDYLQRQLLLTAWTRAIVLNRYDEAIKLTPDVIKAAPEMKPVLDDFLQAAPAERAHEALFVLLKFPNLSPYVAPGVPSFQSSEDLDYYFESAWWCELPNTEFNDEGEEVPKRIRRPDFLSSQQVAAAAAERKQLDDLEAGKTYLAQQVLKWAKESPKDPRVPEALYVAYQANEPQKYGCGGGWQSDEEAQTKIEKVMRRDYAASGWTARLPTDR